MSRRLVPLVSCLALSLAACRTSPTPRAPGPDAPPAPAAWYEDRVLFVGLDPPRAFAVELVRVVHDDEVVRRYRIDRIDRDGVAGRLDRLLHGGGDPGGVPPLDGLVFERDGGALRMRYQGDDHRVEIQTAGEDLDLGAGPGASLRIAPGRAGEDWRVGEGLVRAARVRLDGGRVPADVTEVLVLDGDGGGWLVREAGGEGRLHRVRQDADAEMRAVEVRSTAEGLVAEAADGTRLEVRWTRRDGEGSTLPAASWVAGAARTADGTVAPVTGVFLRRTTEIPPPSPGPRDRKTEHPAGTDG